MTLKNSSSIKGAFDSIKGRCQQQLAGIALCSLEVGGTQQQDVQQAWLPQHTIAEQLVHAFKDAVQHLWYALDGSPSAIKSQRHSRADSSRSPASVGTGHATGIPHVPWCANVGMGPVSHWAPQRLPLQQLPTAADPASCPLVTRKSHTAAAAAAVQGWRGSTTGSSSTRSTRRSRRAGTQPPDVDAEPAYTEQAAAWVNSRPQTGCAHRPLFSRHSSNGSRAPSSTRPHDTAAGADDPPTRLREGVWSRQAAAGAVSDEEWEEAAAAAPTDLRNPEQWYATVRAMAPRSLVAHLGPTNSGKTHASLVALAAAPSGVYCGPLRLLACEVADRLNGMGVPCNLVTGQEVRRVKGARHTACTVEMADLTTRVDVAVLDEVQMLGDRCRGWSWTRVLLGLPAAELHLCGDPAAAGLLEHLAAECGDTLSTQHYRRLAPLVVQPEALSGLHQIQDGDCVVAFGRKTLHRLRKNILLHMDPSHTNTDSSPSDSEDTPGPDTAPAAEHGGWYTHSCSGSEDDDDFRSARQQQEQQEAAAARAFQGVGMVYGALPPESRRTQAALFNARGDVWPRTSVLVASDAVGMGLNLNIRRIVFTTLHKYDGVETRPLSSSEIKQIAGRAGRYASGHAEGYVSVLNADDLPLLREALATATPHITQACLLPRFEQLEAFVLDHHAAHQHHSSLGRSRKRPLSFHKLLRTFAASSQLTSTYFLADMKNMLLLAKLLRHVEPFLGLSDMYTCCISPASADDGPVVQALLQIATSYAYERSVTPSCITQPCPQQPPRTPAEMKTAEEIFRVYDLYLWLYDRLGAPGVFSGRRQVLQQRQHVAELIDSALQEMGGVRGWQ